MALASVLGVGCAGAVREHFESGGLRYPTHVEVRPQKVDVARLTAAGCKEDAAYTAALEGALSLVDSDLVDTVRLRACPLAEAVALHAPFIAIEPDDSAHPGRSLLAMHIECFFDESPLSAFSIKDLSRPYRTTEAEVAIDSWRPLAVSGGALRLWNIALLEIRPGRLELHDVLFHYDEAEFVSKQIDLCMVYPPDWVPPDVRWWRCGRTRPGQFPWTGGR